MISAWFMALALAQPLAAKMPDNTLTDAEKKAGWVLLFDGKSLAGWNGDPGVWRVEDGAISGKALKVAANTFLIREGEFSDFILEVDGMLIPGRGFTNSGIQYRSRIDDAKTWRVAGYQADIGDGWWGTLYDEKGRGVLARPTRAGKKAAKMGEWFHYKISAVQAELDLTLNGVLAITFNDRNARARRLSGVIALQYHAPGEGFEIRFKNIKLRRVGKKTQ